MLRLGENWGLSLDEHCVAVLKRSVVKDKNSKNYGKEYWIPTWYYSDMKQALKGLINKDLQGQITDDFSDLLNRLEQLENKIDNMEGLPDAEYIYFLREKKRFGKDEHGSMQSNVRRFLQGLPGMGKKSDSVPKEGFKIKKILV